jgi:hypothetical protein
MASTSSVTAPVTGLLVYQTGAPAGFYYYGGSAWIFIQNSGNANVTLQGNTFNGASQLVQLNASSQLPLVSGINLTSLNASNLGSGTVPLARLGTNSPSGTTFLKGDNTWATPAGGGGATLDLVATNTAVQNIAIGGAAVPAVTLTFNTTVTTPTLGSWDGSTYTAGVAGTYLIVGNATATTTGAILFPQIVVGSNIFYGAVGVNLNYPPPLDRAQVTAVVSLIVGSTVILKVNNGSTTAASSVATDGSTRISITKL